MELVFGNPDEAVILRLPVDGERRAIGLIMPAKVTNDEAKNLTDWERRIAGIKKKKRRSRKTKPQEEKQSKPVA